MVTAQETTREVAGSDTIGSEKKNVIAPPSPDTEATGTAYISQHDPGFAMSLGYCTVAWMHAAAVRYVLILVIVKLLYPSSPTNGDASPAGNPCTRLMSPALGVIVMLLSDDPIVTVPANPATEETTCVVLIARSIFGVVPPIVIDESVDTIETAPEIKLTDDTGAAAATYADVPVSHEG